MKSNLQKSFHGLTAKLAAFAVGVACYAAILSPSNVSAAEGDSPTQLKYLQLMVVLTGEAPWFPAGATPSDYEQWARNNGMRPSGGWSLDTAITSDQIAETLVQLLGYSTRPYGGDPYLTLHVQGINLTKMETISNTWITEFMDNPWQWSKSNPTSPKDPKYPTDPKNPNPKGSKDDKGKGRGYNRR